MVSRSKLRTKERTTWNLLAVSKVLTLLLGPEQKKKMYDFVRTEDGIVSAQTVSEMIVEILATKKETKN